MTSGSNPTDGPTDYSNQEFGQMMFDMNARYASYDKKLMSQQFDLEAFTRRQDATNKKIEDTLNRLIETSLNRNKGLPDHTTPASTPRGWNLPPSSVQPPTGTEPEALPRIQISPPRFNGENATDWIRKIQKYYNHHYTPLHDRLYLTSYLFDHPASEWMSYWEDNNKDKGWDAFLLAVKLRFDPDLYVDYVGRLANLRQTSSVEAYQTAFETILQKVSHVEDSTLSSLFVAGLKEPLKQELLTRRPATLHESFALAQQLAACQAVTASFGPSSRATWTARETRQNASSTPTAQPTVRFNQPPGRNTRDGPQTDNIPIVRVSAAERAERTKKGLCWYCDDLWSRTHVCSKKFYALMGADEDDDDVENNETTNPEDDGETMVITGDVSSIQMISPKIKPRAIRLQGTINGSSVSVLIDGGSTHNFIKPVIAEQLSLSVHSIKPFRVFVGNGESLRCSYACLQTPISLQGHSFTIDLFILQVEGPDVILGVQWLQDLGDVTKNYRNLTMKFEWETQPVFLQGDGAQPRQISYNNLFSLIGQEPECEMFEMIPVPPETLGNETDQQPPPSDPTLAAILARFQAVFAIPAGLPPPRRWDHRIHLPEGSNPITVRPYRYPYFQKTEIERQVKEMLTQGVIQHSTSPFSSPVLLVRKKDGSFRFCVDYRALNAATTPDHFPIPTADELFDELSRARIFSKLDLRSGYHQIRMHIDDVHKTTFRTHDGHFEFLVMPFGLTNAPSTFQAAMNSIFQPFLRQFVIVFFDDILIYSNSLADHASHLEQVLHILSLNCFFVKLSKCSFGVDTIEYLGHIVSAGELRADTSKLEAMTAWPTPMTVKQLRGFLGLTGYYRRFVKNYSIIAAPLTDLLKKDTFRWSDIAESSFKELKVAMSAAPVLHLPDFTIPFVIETDASDFGIGAVLLQNGHPLAYFSKKLGPRRRLSSTYHKELYAIVEAVQKWRQYLLGREFIIRSDQRSLKDLLSQIVQTPDQQFYIRKLMGFKFTIEYKSGGASNRVADALSRRDQERMAEEPRLLAMFARPTTTIMGTIRLENTSFPDLVGLHQAVADRSAPAHISVADGLLYFKHRLYISRDSAARAAILEEAHCSKTAGHPGDKRTFARVATSFFWPGMRGDIRKFVAACQVCQATKYITDKPSGLIQPIPIPELVWAAASMDFIVGFPPSHGYTAIMVVVDRLSKYAHFGALPTGFDAPKVAHLFVNTVVKLHGFPDKLLTDRDAIFMSEFWTELLSMSGTKLQFTTAYHPQTDGQSEVTNRGLEQYLRAFTFEQPRKWFEYLPWAELAMNCSSNVSIGMSPFKALYGREPPNIFGTPATPSHNTVVTALLGERTDLLRSLKGNLAAAQQRMADSANKHRRHLEFEVGDDVLLRLQPYRQVSVSRPLCAKLARRYYGPFKVKERIGAVAYRLQLPLESRIHDVFHVALLKPFVPPLSESAQRQLPIHFRNGRPIDVPIRAVKERTVLHAGLPQYQWLVQWATDVETLTWEPKLELLRHFPSLSLEDKTVAMGGGVDRDLNNHSPPSKEAETIEEEEEDAEPKELPEPPVEAVEDGGPNKRPKRKTSRPSRYRDFTSH